MFGNFLSFTQKKEKERKEDDKKSKIKPKPLKTESSAKAEIEKKFGELSHRLAEAENRAKKESELLIASKNAMEKDILSLQVENEKYKVSNEKLLGDNNQLRALYTKLQSKLSETYNESFQGREKDEEIKKLKKSLEEEKQCRKKLMEENESHRVENSEKDGSQKIGREGSKFEFFVDEIRVRDENLSASIEKYRHTIDSLTLALEHSEEKLTGKFDDEENNDEFKIKTEYRRLLDVLSSERKRSLHDYHRFIDVNSLFMSLMKDYQSSVELLRKSQKEIQNKIFEQKSRNELESCNKEILAARILEAESALKDKDIKMEAALTLIKKQEEELETLPVLKAQIEVYASDFNAEREAREKIAGEKNDLEEEYKKLLRNERGREVHRFDPLETISGNSTRLLTEKTTRISSL